MTASEFREQWTNEEFALRPIPDSVLTNLGLKAATRLFLSSSGLPEYAEPGLSFVAAGDPEDRIGRLNALFDSGFGDGAEGCIHIGAANDGNDMIAIDTSAYDRVLLFHVWDNSIVQFVNSSIHSLANFLVLYRNFEAIVKSGKSADDPMRFYDFTDAEFEELRDGMARIDPEAVSESTFWADELRTLHDIRHERREGPKGI